ncbi:DNA polymerase III subunit chi [Vibrio quintilis]|uniref:DNA polymerase III subunit chi n=1 Tax=Vibrio quintilis TaxID=1117707 RepID=A0A1M7YQQ1_9VIBR|nr:DNA polymerase III subunit chi [Vibrio quintilis]SHO54895.1 DNA polymerase III subunit chi [Vibrio quintilis]
MKTVTFYIVRPESPQADTDGFLQYVHFLARHFSRQGAKIFINCHSKEKAEMLAEIFWQVEPKDFIAHNLVGEGPGYGTHVEIGYQGIRPAKNRQLLINLADCQTTFANHFNQVVDFVPCEENARQLARERYKIYRQADYQLQTIEIHYPE